MRQPCDISNVWMLMDVWETTSRVDHVDTLCIVTSSSVLLPLAQPVHDSWDLIWRSFGPVPVTRTPRCFHKRDRICRPPQPLVPSTPLHPRFTDALLCNAGVSCSFLSGHSWRTSDPVVQFKVRYPRDLGYDEATRYLHSSSPPPQASASKRRSTPVPPVMIACVSGSSLSR